MNAIDSSLPATSTVATIPSISKSSTFVPSPPRSSPGMDLAPVRFTKPRAAQSASAPSSMTNSRRRRYTKKGAAGGAKEKPNQSTRPQPETASTLPNSTKPTERQVIRIPLDSSQLERLKPILDTNRNATKLEGILCTLSRAYSPAAGLTVLELQVLPVD